MSSPTNYDISLSFAGENRDYVEKVAQALRAANVSVFYDAYEEVALWGRDLYQHLHKVYSTSRYCVIFVSEAYAHKLWTRHELRSAQARALTEQREYILPARFDATELPGLPPTIGYIDLSKRTPEEFALLILKKLDDDNKWQGEIARAGVGVEGVDNSVPEHPQSRGSNIASVPPSGDDLGAAPLPRSMLKRAALTAAVVLIALMSVVVVVKTGLRWRDQHNCGPNERWVGMNPHRAEWLGQVTPERAKDAVFYGELRWAPEVDGVKKTTVGRVELEVDARTAVIYEWNSPGRATHSFAVRVGHLLVGTSGRFKIRWVWEDGTSGVCVAKSYVMGHSGA